MMVSKTHLPFQGAIFRFHVKLQGCISLWCQEIPPTCQRWKEPPLPGKSSVMTFLSPIVTWRSPTTNLWFRGHVFTLHPKKGHQLPDWFSLSVFVHPYNLNCWLFDTTCLTVSTCRRPSTLQIYWITTGEISKVLLPPNGANGAWSWHDQRVWQKSIKVLPDDGNLVQTSPWSGSTLENSELQIKVSDSSFARLGGLPISQ